MRWALLPFFTGKTKRAKERRINYRKLQRNLLLESLEHRQLLTFAITGYHLHNDTGTAYDNITADPRVTGTVSGAATSGPWTVAFDINNDGTPDGTTTSDAMGVFVYDPGNIAAGAITVKARAQEVVSGSTVYTSWSSLTYTFSPTPNDPPEIDDLELINDDGESETDGITSDPRIQGIVVNPDGPSAFVEVQIDHDGDNIVDGTTRSGADGKFTYIPRNLDAGEVELRVRAMEIEPRTSDELYGDWFSLEFEYDPQPRGPEIEFTLKNDNLAEPDDLITSDPTLIGQVLEVSGYGIPMVEFDFNGDETPDTSILTDHSGEFTYKPTGLTTGEVTVYARGADWDSEFSEYVYGPWTEFTFTLAAAGAPVVSNLRLKRDTGAADDDLLTRDATILGDTSTDDGPKPGVIIQFDHDEDNVIDGQTTTVTGGGFTYVPQDLEEGEYTFRARSATPIEGTEDFDYGDWEDFTFTYEVNDPAVIDELKLLRDDGVSSTDFVTTDSRLVGEITNDGSLDRITIEFDHNNDETADGYGYTTADGKFVYSPMGLQPGEITIRARAIEWDEEMSQSLTGEWVTITFTLVGNPEEQPQPPPADDNYGSAASGAEGGVNKGLGAAAAALSISAPAGTIVLPFATLVGLSEDIRSVIPLASTTTFASASYSGTIPLSETGDSENGDYEITGSAVLSWSLVVTGSSFTASLSLTTTYEYEDTGVVTVKGQARTYSLAVDGVYVLVFSASGTFSTSGGVTTHSISSYSFSEDHDAESLYSESASLVEGWSGGYVFTSEIVDDMAYDESGSFSNANGTYTQGGSSTLISGYVADSVYAETGIKSVNGVTVDYDLDATMTATLDRSRPISSFSATQSTQSATGTFTTDEEQTADWNVTTVTTLSQGGSGNGVDDSYTGEITTTASYAETTTTADDGTLSVSGSAWTIDGDMTYDVVGSGAYETEGEGEYSYEGPGSTRAGSWTIVGSGDNDYTEEGGGSYTVVDEVVTVAAGTFISTTASNSSETYSETGAFSSAYGTETSSGTFTYSSLIATEIDETGDGEYATDDDVTTTEITYENSYKLWLDDDSTITVNYETEENSGTETTVLAVLLGSTTTDEGTVTIVEDVSGAEPVFTSESTGVAISDVGTTTTVSITGEGEITQEERTGVFEYTASTMTYSTLDETSNYTEELDAEGTFTFSSTGPYAVTATSTNTSTYHEEGTITLGGGYGEGPGDGEEGGGDPPPGGGGPPGGPPGGPGGGEGGGGEGGEGGGEGGGEETGTGDGQIHLTATYTLDITGEGSLTYADAGTFTESGVFYLEETEDNTYTSTRAGASTTALLSESLTVYTEAGAFYIDDPENQIDATYTLSSSSSSNLDYDDASDYEETISLAEEEITIHSEATSDSTTLLILSSDSTYAEDGSIAVESEGKAGTYTLDTSDSFDLNLDDATNVTITIDATIPAEGESEIEVDVFINLGATTLAIDVISASDYTEEGSYDKDDVAGLYTLAVSADTSLSLDDVSATLDDETTGTISVDLIAISSFDYTDDGVDTSDENSTLNFLITATSTTTLTVENTTTYSLDDEDYLPSTTSDVTLSSISETTFTGTGSFEEGDTEGTFAISSTTDSSLLLTSEETVTVTTWNDVEAGKVTETEISGETTLLITFESTSTQSSEWTTTTISSPGPDSSSEGSTSASTTVEMLIEGLETTTGTLTKFENEGSFVPPPNTIFTEGETVTTGQVYSTFHYEEEGTSTDSYSSGDYDTEMDSHFGTGLDSITDIDILSTETSTSEWTLLNYGDEEEEIEIVGFAITSVDGETTLDYDSDFSFNMSTTIETTSDDSSMLIDTDVTSTNISLVDSLHTTHDTYLVERELEEGEVVETSTRDYSGSFSTDAHMTSNTDTLVEGSYDLSISTSGGGGGPPPGPGMPPPPTTPPMSIETHITWSDDRSSTTTTIAEQSGSYGDDEEDSSSSSLSVTSVDEYFSTMEGTDARDIDGYITSGNFTHEREGSSEHQFHDSKSFSSEGNEASWSTSYETENSWTIHAEITEFGYTIVVNDSDSDSYSESSGGQSYEPGEEDNPSNGYQPPVGTYGEGGSGSGGGDDGLEDGSNGDFVERTPALDLLKQFLTPPLDKGKGHIVNLPHIIKPGDQVGPTTTHLFMTNRMLEEGRRNGFWTPVSSQTTMQDLKSERFWIEIFAGVMDSTNPMATYRDFQNLRRPNANAFGMPEVGPDADTASVDNDDPESSRRSGHARTGISFIDDYIWAIGDPSSMDMDLRIGFYISSATAAIAAATLAVVVAAPCVVGGTATTAFGVTLSGGTLAGNFAVGSGITGVTSIAGNLIAGRDPFSNAPINMLVGGLTNMIGGGTRGLSSVLGNGLGGVLEGGFNSWLNGGTSDEIARDAALGGALNAGLSGLLNRFMCFAKDTPVWTSEGPKPIGEIKPGEKVRAFHFEQGEWVHATVTDRSDNTYQGPLVTVEVGGSKIETTVYHPFWVVEGQNLDERAVPKELLPEEDEGKSLGGRWVNSHDLRAGDKIYTLSGKIETIQAVSQRFEESFAVCNLTIDERHNYAVGLCGVLVHNTSPCGEIAEHAASTFLKKQGHKILGAFQNASGHGVDLITRYKGQLFVWEIKGSTIGQFKLSPAQAQGASAFAQSRLARLLRWNVPEGMQRLAGELLDEIQSQGGVVNGGIAFIGDVFSGHGSNIRILPW